MYSHNTGEVRHDTLPEELILTPRWKLSKMTYTLSDITCR